MSTITEAREASQRILDATEKLDDLLRAMDEAAVIGVPRSLAGSLEDVEAEVAFTERKLATIKAYIERERHRHGK